MGKFGFALAALGVGSIQAFYLPGVAPRDYQDGEVVGVKVNKLDSVQTQLPYEYYSLPFCQPEHIQEAAENLGEVLSGDRIETGLYEVSMKIIESCKILCRKTHNQAELDAFAERIQEEYRVNWIIDNIPAATKYYTEDIDTSEDGSPSYSAHYDKGFALGYLGSEDIPNSSPGIAYINNHVRLIIFYHQDQASFSGFRIVGFEVEPFSVNHKIDGQWKGLDTKLKTCSPLEKVTRALPPQPVSSANQPSGEEIYWTYDVMWEESDVKWASRWDLYLKMTDSEIHWFSIVNSIMIVLFLSGIIAMILMRTLHRDLRRYNEIELTAEEQQEETGWKLIHGEVFRPPQHGGMLSVLVGTGVQVFAMTLLTLTFALLGFLSPANRGGLMTALLLLFVFMGMLAGYFSTRVYKMFKLTEWKRNTLVTALFFPGIMFTGFFILNLFVWGEKSSGAVPFATLVALLVLWLGISVPLVYLGSYFAFKKPAIEPPLRVNNIPRMLLPDRNWYMSPVVSVLVGGVLPFGAVFMEIFFIMSSVWLHQFYYVFGFLFIVFIILIITCAEISIVMCYFQLCNEDYHWWWRSYLTSGSSALYLFLYSILYFFTKLEIIKFVSGMLFFGYMFLVSFAFFVLTGTIGYFACFFFVRKIYSSIKID
jgi:transmembrane 9 superfamily protein 2/4